jgi:AcrR family transcriptional regulator
VSSRRSETGRTGLARQTLWDAARTLRPASEPQRSAVVRGVPNLDRGLGLKGAHTRRRIMAATADFIGTRPFADVRITEIAQAAQIAQSSFYNYFTSVEDVIRALAEDVSLEPLARLVEVDWSGRGGLSLSRQLMEAAFELWQEHRAVLNLVWFLADERQGMFPELRTRQVRGLYKAFEAQVRRSQATGRIAPEIHPRLAGYECVGLIASAATRYGLLLRSGFTHAQLVETNARLLHMIATGLPPRVEEVQGSAP